jgi:outer membrane lipoprotein-sorting protein
MRWFVKVLCVMLAVALSPAWLAGVSRAAGVGLVDGLWVMKKVDERYEGDDVQEDLRLTLESVGSGVKPRDPLDVRWLKKHYGREKGLIVHFVGPRYAAGVTLNMRIKPYMDDDRWLYFPEAKLVRRVFASDKYSNFMGTDYTYYDLSERESDEENHKLLRIEEFQGAPCYVVETTPKDPKDDFYARKVTWVDKDRFVKLRIQYYDKQGKLKKQYDPANWQQIAGIWTPMRLVMEDFVALHRTTIERTNVRYNKGIKDDFFEPRNIDCVQYQGGVFSLLPFDQRPTKVWEEKLKQKQGLRAKVPTEGTEGK